MMILEGILGILGILIGLPLFAIGAVAAATVTTKAIRWLYDWGLE